MHSDSSIGNERTRGGDAGHNLSSSTASSFSAHDSRGNTTPTAVIVLLHNHTVLLHNHTHSGHVSASASAAGPAQSLHGLHGDHPQEDAGKLVCMQASGLWILLSDAAHAQDNLFEEGVSAWYPTYLMTHFGLSGMDSNSMHGKHDSSQIRITHIGGTKRGFLAFHEVYGMLGQYVPWQTVRGGSASQATCVEFETAITIRIYWSWLNAPVVAMYNPALSSFSAALGNHLTQGAIKHPSTCRRRFLFAARTRSYRAILNRDEVMAAVRVVLVGYEVTMVDLSILPLGQQARLVSQVRCNIPERLSPWPHDLQATKKHGVMHGVGGTICGFLRE